MGKWEPDPVPADVVRQIYQMALNGMATAQIRDKLSEAKYPTPLEYIEMKRGKDIVPAYVWTARMVYRMLTNEQYTGSYVSGKQESKAIGSHSKIHKDRESRIVFPNSHPPIVTKEDFAKVQELLMHRKSSTTGKPLISPLVDENRPRRRHMVSGERVATTPIYGYLKGKDGNLEIDETAATVIRAIYEMAAQGLSCAEIAEKLFALGHPTPSEYIKLSRGNEITPTNRWTVKCVREILKNEQYTGAYVSGKILKDYKTGKKYHTPQNEWIVIPDKNPAIVSKELFSEIQRLTAQSRAKRKNMRRREYLLNGKAVCGCCGYALMYDDSSENKTYRCNHTMSDPSAACHKMKADAAEVEETVMTIIKKQAEAVLGSVDLTNLRKTGDEAQNFAAYEAKLSEVMELRKDFYDQYLSEEIDLDTFMAKKKECTDKIEQLNKQIVLLKKSKHDKLSHKKSAKIAKDTLSSSAIPRDVVEALIEKVFIFPGKQIEINWKIVSFADMPMGSGV